MFEYQILRADGFVSVEELNALGLEGWELVSILGDDEGYDYIFKKFIRPLSEVFQRAVIKRPPSIKDVMERFKDVNPV